MLSKKLAQWDLSRLLRAAKYVFNLLLLAVLVLLNVLGAFLLGAKYGQPYAPMLGVLPVFSPHPVVDVDFNSSSVTTDTGTTMPTFQVFSPVTNARIFDLVTLESLWLSIYSPLGGNIRDSCVIQGRWESMILCTIVWSEKDHVQDQILKPWPRQGWVTGAALFGSEEAWENAKNYIPMIQKDLLPSPLCPQGYVGCLEPTATSTPIGFRYVKPGDAFYVTYGGATITNTVGFASGLPMDTEFIVQGKASIGTLVFGTAFLKDGSSKQGWLYSTKLRNFPTNALQQLDQLPILPLPDKGGGTYYSTGEVRKLPCPVPYPTGQPATPTPLVTPTAVVC